jgi:pilus assembly protein CpaE
LVLNQVGVPKRPEIAAADFRKAIGPEVAVTVPFDPASFGAALNNGRMVLDMAPRSKAAEAMRKLARDLAGDKPGNSVVASGQSILKKLLSRGKV